MKKKVLSTCCRAQTILDGTPDFPGDREPVTVHYVCTKCEQPCDIIVQKVKKKRRP